VRLRDVARISYGGRATRQPEVQRPPGCGHGDQAGKRCQRARHDRSGEGDRARLQPLPEGLSVIYPLDTAPYVQHSFHDVMKTLRRPSPWFLSCCCSCRTCCDAHTDHRGTRVLLAPARCSRVSVFRSTASPVRHGVAIGLLVDDAIVVVESVERVMEEEHLGPKEATDVQWSRSRGRWSHSAGARRRVHTDGFLQRLRGVIYVSSPSRSCPP